MVTTLDRIEDGNFSNIRSVGKGVLECRINFGPGYRVYFYWGREDLAVLLGGGAKQRQQQDFEAAQRRRREHQKRQQEEA